MSARRLAAASAAALITIATLMALDSRGAVAGCSCNYVNGSVQSVCSYPGEMHAACASRICPIEAAPAARAADAYRAPPIGTASCRQVRVCDYTTGCRWERVCS